MMIGTRLLIEIDEVELLLDKVAITFIDEDGRIDDKPARKAYRDLFDEMRDFIHMTGESVIERPDSDNKFEVAQRR